jgi:hypothetical protein
MFSMPPIYARPAYTGAAAAAVERSALNCSEVKKGFFSNFLSTK